MDVAAVYGELYGRIPPLAGAAVEGLDEAALARTPAGAENSIGWLVWHCARLQDHHISELLGSDQLWVADGWAERLGMEPDPDDMGFGHSAEQAAAVRPGDPGLLLAYLGAAQQRTESLLAGVTPDSLSEVVDRRWDRP
ncbi:MAG: DinB family protein [Microthrixaceae bacterium]